MSSCITRIEVYEDDDGLYYFGCPDLNLMGYGDIDDLMKDIRDTQKSSKEDKS